MPRLTASFMAQPAPFGPICTMRRVRWSSTLRARCDVGGLPAEQREELALAHGRDRAEDRRIDQACALGGDRRRQFTMGHRLQRAHLDEELAGNIAARNPSGAVNTRRTPLSSVMIDSTTPLRPQPPAALCRAKDAIALAGALGFWSHATTSHRARRAAAQSPSPSAQGQPDRLSLLRSPRWPMAAFP